MSDRNDLIDVASIASSTVGGCLTPTYTIPDGDFNPMSPTLSIPAPDATFIIRQHETGKVIALEDGELRLADPNNLRGGYHWRCVRTSGWFGFRNCVSGTYIGHNERRKFIASARHHKPHEYFTPVHHRCGGYELLIRHGNDMRSMAVADDGASLIEVNGDGALWDFLET
ncbi:hypothetical protein jhhlp_008483 [Lomentospora prolificans]|uniref:Ricin B lectin domain-containing protein n=1 Tax=Lomentospora prolificans TaxID=41688 RepID=A0A2N3MY71_9PEZI|nr:hypothetical protein jhhlp_008483 [Lomentospora prolificans]